MTNATTVAAPKRVKTTTVALIGNPNSGKTTLFNALTGLRQKVANYPGVTIEERHGRARIDGLQLDLIDLPGCYSLFPRSPDESIVCDLLFGKVGGRCPDAVICLVDATNVGRHLYLTGQVIDLGIPVVVALTMSDEAQRHGIQIDRQRLSEHLGVPVVPVMAPDGVGLVELAHAVAHAVSATAPLERGYRLPPPLEARLRQYAPEAFVSEGHLLYCLAGQHMPTCSEKVEAAASRIREELHITEDTVRRYTAEARYDWQGAIARDVVRRSGSARRDRTNRLDDVLLHKIFGPVVLCLVLAVVFQSVFAWAGPVMDGVSFLMEDLLPSIVSGLVAPGPFLSLINDGIFAGVGAVVVFLPQILFLFFFLTLLEDSGYMARAAFILDRVMSRVGLSGRSFIPLLSCYACAIPGIMATRTIPNARERLATILVAPLMTCSARLIVYTLLVAAFVPAQSIWGPIGLQGVVLLGLYLLGVVGAAASAWAFRKTMLRGPKPPFLLELPPYRRPRLKTLALTLMDRGRVFLVNAGTIIFAVSIVLWAMLSFPKSGEIEARSAAQQQAILQSTPLGAERDAALLQLENERAAQQIRHSIAGRIGLAMEPALRPLGFDWKIGIGILGSFAAREVFVSTLGVVYGVGSEVEGESLIARARADRNPQTGAPVWSTLVAITLLVFYAFALQCISTVAVMRRETNSWRWPLFAFAYMTVLAYAAAFVTRQIGLLIA